MTLVVTSLMKYQLDYFCTLQVFSHLQVRGWESFSHGVTPKIRKVLENILLWPSDKDESKTLASGYRFISQALLLFASSLYGCYLSM